MGARVSVLTGLRLDGARAPWWTGPGPRVNGPVPPGGWGPDSGPLVGRCPGLMVDDVRAPVTRVDGGPGPRVDGVLAPGCAGPGPPVDAQSPGPGSETLES